MTRPSLADLNAFVPWLALVLATTSLWLQRADRRPRLKLRVTRGSTLHGEIEDPSSGRVRGGERRPTIICEVRNVGAKELSARSVNLVSMFGRVIMPATPTERDAPLGSDTKRDWIIVLTGSGVPSQRRFRLYRAVRFVVTDHMGRTWRSRFILP